ncbi:adenylate kinase 7 isoform X2 [Oryzias melastigma]|uniref:adenylate kinase 7 isoform X2 n=1 Tax=Oryzias melastigma TaxID=30732 RepID=UPI000CF83BBD|nr:adenylate kinase 7 isoform X2 [Oryzias melastigma]
MESNTDPNKPKRVFINDVDEFSSRNIAKFLSRCEAGKTFEEEEEGEEASEEPSVRFQVVGTVSSSACGEETAFLRELYVSPTRDDLFQLLLECDVVVYNVSESSSPQQVDEASWAVTALHEAAESFKAQKMFILVSSVMGWASTAPKDPSNKDELPSDVEFWKRRPHPRFKSLNTLEKVVIRLSKMSKLKCYVVAAGLQYGLEENIFHYFFKVSWMLETPEVPVFGQGTNHIPTIHVFDLGGVIQNIIQLKPKSKYFLAVDKSKDTLESIVESISDVLGFGRVCRLSMEEAVAMKALKPQETDRLSIDLHLDAANVNRLLSLNWRCQSGLVQNMESMVQEFKDSRQLQPIRICLLGPPAVGKSTVAEMICKHYKIHRISTGKIIKEKISQLKETLFRSQTGYFSAEAAAAAQEELEKINQSMESSQGHLTEGQVFKILQDKLNSKPCRNQGFVLDGLPETFSQASMLFSTEDTESRDSDVESRAPGYNKIITPDYVFSLEASDDFLTERVRDLPQGGAEEAQLEQDELLSRLSRYRRLQEAEETVLDFFDFREIHSEHIELSADDPEYVGVVKRITEVVGLPKNYSRSFEEHKEGDPLKKEAERRQVLAAERRRRKEAALAEMAAQHEAWHRGMQEVQRQEKERLEAAALPLRIYLMEFVVPTITEAMTQCCALKPDDPVDFLAEFLLKNEEE